MSESFLISWMCISWFPLLVNNNLDFNYWNTVLDVMRVCGMNLVSKNGAFTIIIEFTLFILNYLSYCTLLYYVSSISDTQLQHCEIFHLNLTVTHSDATNHKQFIITSQNYEHNYWFFACHLKLNNWKDRPVHMVFTKLDSSVLNFPFFKIQ